MKSRCGLTEEIPVFVDTNLGTRLAVSVPPDITAGHLKCRLGQEHSSCFANLGEIKVHTLMVKRRSHFYHLPDVMPLKSAFRGFTGTWFLQMQASRMQDMDIPSPKTSVPSIVTPTELGPLGNGQPLKPVDLQKLSLEDQMSKLRENKPSMSSGSDVTDCTESEIFIGGLGHKNRVSLGNEEQPEVLPVPTPSEKDRRENDAADETHILESFSGLNPEGGMQMEGNATMDNRNAKNLLSGHPLESKEAPSLSKVISVTGIISRYFSDSDELNSCSKQGKPQFEETHTDEIVGSTLRASECSVDQVRPNRIVESDTDTICSVNNVIVSDVNQFKVSLADRNAFSDFSKVGRAAKRGYCSNAKNATGSVVRNKTSRSRRKFSPPSSDKLQIGKKMIQAANNISIFGSGRKLSRPPFMSRCGNLAAPESDVLFRSLVFEIDNLDD